LGPKNKQIEPAPAKEADDGANDYTPNKNFRFDGAWARLFLGHEFSLKQKVSLPESGHWRPTGTGCEAPTTSKILRFEAGVLGNAGKHSGTNVFAVMKREH
jgi:hypothetical protein